MTEKGMTLIDLLGVFSTCKDANPFGDDFPPSCILEKWDEIHALADDDESSDDDIDLETCFATCSARLVVPAPAPEEDVVTQEPELSTRQNVEDAEEVTREEALEAASRTVTVGGGGGGPESKIPLAFPEGYTDKLAIDLLIASLTLVFALTVCRAILSAVRVALARRRYAVVAAATAAAEHQVAKTTSPSPPITTLEFRNVTVLASPAYGINSCRSVWGMACSGVLQCWGMPRHGSGTDSQPSTARSGVSSDTNAPPAPTPRRTSSRW